jgi:tRNA U38,U39,U40 pseudouridine synthase TruA
MSTVAGDSLRPSSVTYKSIVAYDGTAFEGFQRQRGEIRTIQADLEAALTA